MTDRPDQPHGTHSHIRETPFVRRHRDAILVSGAGLRHRAFLMPAALRTRRDVSRFAALMLIACALLLRVLIPQGWMPVHTADGWQITICSGTGPMQMDMPADMVMAKKGMHQDPSKQDHNSYDHPCAFSSLAMALDRPPLLALGLPSLIAVPWLQGLPQVVGIGHGLAAPPPPSTGPPVRL